MRRGILTDKLLDLCEHHAEKIAEQWYQAVSTNPRTSSYRSIPKETCLSQAAFLYKNLRSAYFSDNSFQQVRQLLDQLQHIEGLYAKGIPLPEAIYALVLMRRHIWLYSEFQVLCNTALDLQQEIESINRTLLLFDYATYILAQEYHEMAG